MSTVEKKEIPRRRNPYLDVMKAIACIFVVLIHCMFPGKTGLFFRAVARFAVPLFFAVSGYFFYHSDKQQLSHSVYRKIKHLFWIILISGVGYFILEIMKNIVLAKGSFEIGKFFGELVSGKNILRLFITNTPLVYMPRWFLFALIYCYLVMLFFCKKGMDNKWLYGVSVLGLIGLLSLEYISALTEKEFGFYLGNSETFVTFKNIFCFRALPWFVLGMGLKSFYVKLETINIWIYWVMCIVGTMMTLTEASIIGDKSIYFGSILIVAGMFGLAIRKNKDSCKSRFFSMISYIGQSLSLYIYILHGAVMDGFALIEKVIFRECESALYLWIKPILVIIVSLFCSQILFYVSKLGKKKGKEQK